jgi:N-acyl homoserine lactone hydrolase
MPLVTEPQPAVLPLAGGELGAAVRVHPILTGEFQAPSVDIENQGGRLALARLTAQSLGARRRWNWLPVPAFLVEHPAAGPLLIDTGLHPSCATDSTRNMGRAGGLLYHVRMEHDQALRFRLPALGVQATRVRIVIITHLHIDRASAVSEFPQATFLIDRREWAAAADGGILQGYHQRQFDHAFDWRTVAYGSEQVKSFAGLAHTLDVFGDGSVRLVSTPGHTLGHQSVLLRTRAGEVLIAGDAALGENTLPGRGIPFMTADEHLYRRSLRQIQLYKDQTPAATVIGGHDPDLWPGLKAVYG